MPTATTPNVSPLRPTSDLRMFFITRTASGGVQVLKVIGARDVRRQDGTVTPVLRYRAWVAGRRAWQKTVWEIPTSEVLEQASIGTLIRVGLIVRDADGIWL